MRVEMSPVAVACVLLLIAGPLGAQPQEFGSLSTNPPGAAIVGTDCSCSAGADIVLDQSPDQITAFFTDVAQPQAEGEGFVLTEETTIDEIRFWGGYFAGNTPIDPDDFTVIFHLDAAGLPGANAAPPESGLAAACRVATGASIGASDEYVYLLQLTSPVTLSPGTYWLEIFNDTTANPNNVFGWESGAEDPVAGVPSHVFAAETPGVNWILSGSGVSFALQLCSVDVPVEPASPTIEIPTLGQFGLFALLLGLVGVGVRQLRRRG